MSINELNNHPNILDDDDAQDVRTMGPAMQVGSRGVVQHTPSLSSFKPVGTAGPTTIRPTDGINYTAAQNSGVLGNAPISEVADKKSEDGNSESTGNTNEEAEPKAEKKAKAAQDKKTKLLLIGGIVGFVLIIVFLIINKENGGLSSLFEEKTEEQGNGPEVQDWVEMEDPFLEGISDDEWETFSFSYDEEQLAKLRSLGYIADEIEEAQKKETPFEDLVKSAESARRDYLENTMKPYYDARSNEFKKAEADTWLGLEIQDEEKIKEAYEIVYENGASSYETTRTINTDYEKVSPRGSQLFLKIYLSKAHDSWLYYECSIIQYSMLEQSGNIVADICDLDITDEQGSLIYQQSRVLNITIY